MNREQRKQLGQFLADHILPSGPTRAGDGFRATIPNPFPELRSDQKPPEIPQEEEEQEQDQGGAHPPDESSGAPDEAEVEGGEKYTPIAKVEEAGDGEFRVTLSQEQKDLLLSVLEGRLSEQDGEKE